MDISRLLGKVNVEDSVISRLLTGHMYLVFIFLYLPVLVVFVLSFTPQETPSFPMPGFTLHWYQEVLPPNGNSQLLGALGTSLKIAVISSIGSAIIGTAAAMGMVRNNIGSRLLDVSTLNTVFLSPIVVPWVVTGIAVLSLYSFLGIAGSFPSLIIGHILITMPFVVVVVASQLYGFDQSLEEAAKDLGASKLRTFYEVTLPLVAPGIIAGMLFAFTLSFDNFTQTFFWTDSTTSTLPIVIYSQIQFGLTPEINAIGSLIVFFSLTLALAAERLSQRVM
jgi:spermidine/putrescine transport system permease protein